MYGFYISYNDKNYKLEEDMDENIDINEAISCIEKTSSNGCSSVKKIDKYLIKNGQYGPYIQVDKKFFSIPKEYDLDKITKEDCDKIIKIPKKVYKKK